MLRSRRCANLWNELICKGSMIVLSFCVLRDSVAFTHKRWLIFKDGRDHVCNFYSDLMEIEFARMCLYKMQIRYRMCLYGSIVRQVHSRIKFPILNSNRH